MEQWTTPIGLIPPRADDPPFFEEFRIAHNQRVIRRSNQSRRKATRQSFYTRVRSTIMAQMSMKQMREELTLEYPGADWPYKVAKMSDKQVYATYMRIQDSKSRRQKEHK